jgi:hypothetical protein
MHRDALGAGLDHRAGHLEHAGIADVALVAQQGDLVEVDAELGVVEFGHGKLPSGLRPGS